MRSWDCVYHRSLPIMQYNAQGWEYLGIIPGNVGLQYEDKRIIDWNNRKRYFLDYPRFFLLQYTLSGYCIFYEEEGKGRELRKGEGFLIPLPSHTSYRRPLDVPWEWIWITVGGSLMERLMDLFYTTQNSYCFRLPQDSQAIQELRRLYLRVSEGPIQSPWEAVRMITSFLSYFAEELIGNPKRYPLWLSEVLKEMENRVGDPMLSVSDLAKVAHFSCYHFLRLFQKEMGISPYQYLLDLRLRKAMELLTMTSCSVKQVMNEVGYRRIGHFCRAFQQKYGITPGKVRKRFRVE